MFRRWQFKAFMPVILICRIWSVRFHEMALRPHRHELCILPFLLVAPFLLLLLSCSTCVESRALTRALNNTVSALFVFGDSTSDPGNNNFVSTLFKSNFLPYGQDFVDHRPTGRFTNGRLASDYISKSRPRWLLFTRDRFNQPQAEASYKPCHRLFLQSHTQESRITCRRTWIQAWASRSWWLELASPPPGQDSTRLRRL